MRTRVYDDEVEIKAGELTPIVTWGVNPGQSIGVHDRVPAPAEASDPKAVADALSYMGLTAGQPIEGMKVDVAFIGSCTNARLSDLREAARIVKGKHVATHVKALVVPGSVGVARAAEREGLDEVFRPRVRMARRRLLDVPGHEPGQARRRSGLRVLVESQLQGRQGSPTGRTLLMSPAMVAAAAVAGEVMDVKELGLMQCITKVTGRRNSDARQRHRYRPHRPGALPARDHVRGMEAHLFEDDRKIGGPGHNRHPFDVPAYQGASILLVNRNFGCGSSREHAPQAIRRWGIEAIVGESFAEIFFGNSAMIGMPCVTASGADVKALQESGREKSAHRDSYRSHRGNLRSRDFRCPISLPPNVRDAFATGAWDTTGLLLDRYEEVERRRPARLLKRRRLNDHCPTQ